MEDMHFMERLERLGWRETELALRLYREPEIVRLLLREAKAPEAPRIAIALAAHPNPPHVVVARDGAFVTCLGASMSTGDMPIVAFRHIDRVAERYEGLKGSLAYIDWAGDNIGSVRKMWRSVLTDAHRVPREVIAGLAPLVGIFGPHLIELGVREDQVARTLVYDNVNRFMRPGLRPSARDIDILGQIWRLHWATGHLAGLFGLSSQEGLAALNEVLRASDEGIIYNFAPMRFGFWPTTLRGAWLAARIGQGAMRACKRVLGTPEALLGHAQAAVLTTAFVGAAHSRFRAEAQKVLTPGVAELSRLIDIYRQIFSESLGTTMLLDLPGGWKLLNAVEADAVRPFDYAPGAMNAWIFANDPRNVYTDKGIMFLAGRLLGWFARADLIDFYLPEQHLRAIPPWRPEDTLAMVRATVGIGAFRSPAPAPGPPKLGRNEPCSCGSGTKFKRCCGR